MFDPFTQIHLSQRVRAAIIVDRPLADQASGANDEHLIRDAQDLLRLLLDEPTAGLSPSMVEDFCARMRALTRTGKTILLIEHNVEIVMRLSDWVVVMHQGGKIAEGRPAEVRNNVTVMHTYLGITS